MNEHLFSTAVYTVGTVKPVVSCRVKRRIRVLIAMQVCPAFMSLRVEYVLLSCLRVACFAAVCSSRSPCTLLSLTFFCSHFVVFRNFLSAPSVK